MYKHFLFNNSRLVRVIFYVNDPVISHKNKTNNNK